MKYQNIILLSLLILSGCINGYMYWRLNTDIQNGKNEIKKYYNDLVESNKKIDSLKRASEITYDTIYKIKNRILKVKEIQKEFHYIRPDLEEAKKILGI